MDSIFHYVAEIWQWVFGAGGVLSLVLYYGATKRVKKAEATAKEIENLNSVIATLREDVNRLHDDIERMQNRLNMKDAVISQLYDDKALLELKNSQKKSAINCAPQCENAQAGRCPVLIRMQQIEEEYLRTLQRT